jgi:glucokinase
MDGNPVVGVDVGGTKVAAGLVTHDGEIVYQTRTPMTSHGDAAAGLAAVEQAVRTLLNGSAGSQQIAAIGICSPGPLDPKKGVVINPPNLPCWRNFPLGDSVRKLFAVPVKVDNDANAAGLAEARWGAGRGYRNVFYAGIGTGIGTGIVFDGVIYHGRTGAAAEGGHVGIDLHGPVCGCGKRGCIEMLASGTAIARRAREALATGAKSQLRDIVSGDVGRITSYMVGQAADAGDPVAQTIMRDTLDALAYWLGNIIDLIEPDVIVIGGGVSSTLVPHLPEIRQRWKGALVNPWVEEIPMVLARYGDDSGIAGAAALCGPFPQQSGNLRK